MPDKVKVYLYPFVIAVAELNVLVVGVTVVPPTLTTMFAAVKLLVLIFVSSVPSSCNVTVLLELIYVLLLLVYFAADLILSFPATVFLSTWVCSTALSPVSASFKMSAFSSASSLFPVSVILTPSLIFSSPFASSNEEMLSTLTVITGSSSVVLFIVLIKTPQISVATSDKLASTNKIFFEFINNFCLLMIFSFLCFFLTFILIRENYKINRCFFPFFRVSFNYLGKGFIQFLISNFKFNLLLYYIFYNKKYAKSRNATLRRKNSQNRSIGSGGILTESVSWFRG